MRGRLSSFGFEALAMARQAILLPFDAGAPVLPRNVGAGDDVVIFVHGCSRAPVCFGRCAPR